MYYGVGGSADDDPELEERITVYRPPIVGYASRTGTRRNLGALKGADWRLLVSAKGELRTEGIPYALDNGAWRAYQRGEAFDQRAFAVAVDRRGERADWLVLPDIVMGGMASLDFSLKWLERLRGMPCRMLIAVQNGMQVDDVASLLSPAVGIFIGGSTEWKEQTAHVWGSLARRRHCYLHVGRVNSARRLRICAAAGANSFDGTSLSRYAKTLPRLDRATRQADMFAAVHESLEEAQQATADILIRILTPSGAYPERGRSYFLGATNGTRNLVEDGSRDRRDAALRYRWPAH
ncbi:hypothetical protein AWB81_05903 [Caballeronia arationis]|uniref:Uncharacterized protein n=1 Tax=Caballeronia arationis TaxID=1777142 RepID=A0A7Z7N0K9_9BURK|nr:hypothetical protein [Caballeronia arationis]SAL00535.1 hypothetical protein AWB81_05903 [Caballeronia arationis]SOE53037.1 hypothetical protein SAMN05446927_0584 [Caballeronia arationis]